MSEGLKDEQRTWASEADELAGKLEVELMDALVSGRQLDHDTLERIIREHDIDDKEKIKRYIEKISEEFDRVSGSVGWPEVFPEDIEQEEPVSFWEESEWRFGMTAREFERAWELCSDIDNAENFNWDDAEELRIRYVDTNASEPYNQTVLVTILSFLRERNPESEVVWSMIELLEQKIQAKQATWESIRYVSDRYLNPANNYEGSNAEVSNHLKKIFAEPLETGSITMIDRESLTNNEIIMTHKLVWELLRKKIQQIIGTD